MLKINGQGPFEKSRAETRNGVALKHAGAKPRRVDLPRCRVGTSRLTCAPSTPASGQPKYFVLLPFSLSLWICGRWAWRCEHGRSWEVKTGGRAVSAAGGGCGIGAGAAGGGDFAEGSECGWRWSVGSVGPGRWDRWGCVGAGSAHRGIADHVVSADRHEEAPEDRVVDHLARVPAERNGRSG